MKTIFVAGALFLAYVQAIPMYDIDDWAGAERYDLDNWVGAERDGSQDVLEISKSNMIFKCQVTAVEETPGKLALKVKQLLNC